MKLAYILLTLVLAVSLSLNVISLTGSIVLEDNKQAGENEPSVQQEPIEENILLEPVEKQANTESCPDSCDDGDECTEDYCNEETGYKCVYMGIDSAECICGSSCEDYDPCTMDYCDMNTGECCNPERETCCGNGECEEGESHESCPDDCEEALQGGSPPEAGENNHDGDENEQEQGSTCLDVVINEILPAPIDNGIEWVEFYNPTSSDADMSGCYIDDITYGGKSPVQIEDGILVPAGGFWVFETKSVFNNGGDDVNLIAEDGETIIDSFSYESVFYDLSWFRLPDGGDWQDEATDSSTKGSENA